MKENLKKRGERGKEIIYTRKRMTIQLKKKIKEKLRKHYL